ncbi:MAG: F0F1 ATP synthase subunit A [Clostridiales bacterium]|nr:F0F1 ATP synthase subunit A [Clostridiales bacterium]
MSKKKRIVTLCMLVIVCALLVVGIVFTNNPDKESEPIKIAMKDAVLHETNRINFLGIAEVNPAVASAFTVTFIILFASLIIRIFVIPRFRMVPGRFQLLLEELIGFFDNLARTNSPHRNKLLGAYIFSAGIYICFGTLFELLGLQVVTTENISMSMPAPLSDINAAICMGCMSYLFILVGGLTSNGLKGVGQTLKDFSLPISMSFRLFGALLSGLLVTELVYYYMTLSFVLPVLVGIIFTLLHALIQTYVLTMLTSLFYGEVTEPKEDIEPEKVMQKAD